MIGEYYILCVIFAIFVYYSCR